MRQFPHLKRNHRSGNWVYFRRLPAGAQPSAGRQFFERSLKTADLKKVTEAWVAANREFDQLVQLQGIVVSTGATAKLPMRGTPWFEEPFNFGTGPWNDTRTVLDTPPERIRMAVDAWGHRERYRRAQNILNDQQYRDNTDVFEAECRVIGACGHQRNWLLFCPPLIKITHDIVRTEGLSMPVGHHSLSIVHEMVLQEFKSILEAEQRWRTNDFTDMPVSAPGRLKSVAPNNQPYITTKSLVELFVATTRKPKKTASKLRMVARYIDELAGHETTIDEVTKSLLIRLQTEALKIPARLTSLERKSTFCSLAEADYRTTRTKLSPQAVGAWFNLLGGCLNWAVSADLVNKNAASGVKPKIKRMEEKRRSSFDQADLEAIFGANYPKRTSEARYWLPLLGLLTGARLNEIGQLLREDIVFGRSPYIKITDQSDQSGVCKKVKNLSSRRLVPLHPLLITLGFKEYVETKALHVFDELPHPRNEEEYEATKSFSQWFGRYLIRIGVKTPSKVFHSFRHTFVTIARNSGVNPTAISQIIGHESDPTIRNLAEASMTLRYGEKLRIDILYDEVSKLVLPIPQASFLLLL